MLFAECRCEHWAGVSCLESAITLQLGRGLDSPTLRIINITDPTFQQYSIGKSKIFSSPSNDKQKTKGRSQTNFLLMRNICNEAGVRVTRTMTGGGVGCCSAALCVDMTSIFID